jgi:chloride channel protein, CIC family
VKCLIWSISLGSGTSGGVLAPLLMMGGALGAVDALFLPHQGPGFWPLISMGAMLAGTMRSPLTGVIFAFELTGDYHSILPLLIACVSAHAFTVLTMARSILTEKISRRGHHLSREYVVDPLEALAVEDVMRTSITAVPAEATLAEIETVLNRNDSPRGQRVYPVIDANQRLVGVIKRRDIMSALAGQQSGERKNCQLTDILTKAPVVAYPDEPLRLVVNRMAATGLTVFPVVKPDGLRELVGLIALPDLLKARELSVADEHHRERVLRIRVPPSLRWRMPWARTENRGATNKT